MISFSIDKQRDKMNAEWMSRPVDSFKNKTKDQPLALVLTSMEQALTFAYRLKRKLLNGPILGGAYTIIDESLGNHTYMYILEDKQTGFLKALPSKKEKLRESLMDFFPEKYIIKYDEVKGEINYKSIPDLVKLYNSK